MTSIFKKVNLTKTFELALIILLMPIFLLGCKKPDKQEEFKPLGMMYYNYFDTVSWIYNYKGDSLEVMTDICSDTISILEKYNNLFDIYKEYDGINNLCTVNKNAGIQALEVDQELIDFLLYCKELYTKTDGKMNVMLGSVLKLWHNTRTTALNGGVSVIPTYEELEEAYKHSNIDSLEIDEVNKTVYISDKDASIDVGAIGKGYATEKAGQYLESIQANGYVLNIGGNIRTIGTKPDGSGWVTGIKNPLNPVEFSLRIDIKDTACVTSGDYERYYVVDNVRYHHIIDKDTLMPARYFRSVTIVTKDSGLADALSTTLFCMSYEDGLELIKTFDIDIDVVWIYEDGTLVQTSNLNVVE